MIMWIGMEMIEWTAMRYCLVGDDSALANAHFGLAEPKSFNSCVREQPTQVL